MTSSCSVCQTVLEYKNNMRGTVCSEETWKKECGEPTSKLVGKDERQKERLGRIGLDSAPPP